MVINNSTDIEKELDYNLSELSGKLNELSRDPSFTPDQADTINEICRQIFYYLADLKDAVSYLNKK